MHGKKKRVNQEKRNPGDVADSRPADTGGSEGSTLSAEEAQKLRKQRGSSHPKARPVRGRYVGSSGVIQQTRSTKLEILQREGVIVELIRQRYARNVIVGMVMEQYKLTLKSAKKAVEKVYHKITKSFSEVELRYRVAEYFHSVQQDIIGARRAENWQAVTELERLYGQALGVLSQGNNVFATILTGQFSGNKDGMNNVKEVTGTVTESRAPSQDLSFRKLVEILENGPSRSTTTTVEGVEVSSPTTMLARSVRASDE